MGTYETVNAIVDSIKSTVAGIDEYSALVTHWEPVKDKRLFLETYTALNDDGQRELRGVLIMPSASFHSPTFEATGPYIMDTWNFDVVVFRGAQNDDTARDEALERAMDFFDAIRAKWDISGIDVFQVRVTLSSHGFGEVRGYGVWMTHMQASYDVEAGVTLT